MSKTAAAPISKTVTQKVMDVLPTAMPTFKNEQVLSPEQLATYMAIAEAIMPGIVPDTMTPSKSQIKIPSSHYKAVLEETKRIVGSADQAAVEKVFAESVSNIPNYAETVERIFNVYAAEDIKFQIKFILSALK